jgi:hypothetical protein
MPLFRSIEKISNRGRVTALKSVAVAYNRYSGDACFRSLLTPHSARTTVRAVPYWAGAALLPQLRESEVAKLPFG